MNKIFLFFCLLCCIVTTYFFCQKKDVYHKEKFVIVATTSIIADAVREIVQDYAVVHQLMGPGIDPHIYRARESDVYKLADADLIFYNGLHLEGKMGHVLEGMNYFTKTVAVTDALDKTLLRSVDFDDMYDPHVWFDVSLWIQVVRLIMNTLITCDTEHAELYKKNGEAYIQKLATIHAYVQEHVQKISVERRILITAHDAFGYFGQAYGFEVIGLQGLSTDSDISTKDIQKLSDIIVAKKIRAIFVESSISNRALIAVQNAVAAKGWHVEIGDELYSDSLGNEGTDAGSYCGMIIHNVNAIINSLGE